MCFSLPFLAFSLRVCGWTQCLNRLAQAHALGSSVRRAIGCGLRSRAGYVRPQAIERDAQILADVCCSHALADVLESCTRLRCGFAGERLNLVADRRVFVEDAGDCRLMG